HWALTHPDGFLAEIRHQAADLRGRHDDLHRFTLGVHQLALELQRFGGELHRADQDAYAARLHLEGRLAAAEATIAELSRQVREQGLALRFWERLRRLVLPPGGWRHRLLRKSLRLVGRKAV